MFLLKIFPKLLWFLKSVLWLMGAMDGLFSHLEKL